MSKAHDKTPFTVRQRVLFWTGVSGVGQNLKVEITVENGALRVFCVGPTPRDESTTTKLRSVEVKSEGGDDSDVYKDPQTRSNPNRLDCHTSEGRLNGGVDTNWSEGVEVKTSFPTSPHVSANGLEQETLDRGTLSRRRQWWKRTSGRVVSRDHDRPRSGLRDLTSMDSKEALG